MLSSPTLRPSSTDQSFFSPSKVASSSSSPPTSNVRVNTTVKTIPRHIAPTTQRSISSPYPSSATSSAGSSPLSSPFSCQKRKSSPLPEVSADLHRDVKRLRASVPGGKTRKRPSTASSRHASRASSATRSRPPSPEPIYRISRSRSGSAYPDWDEEGIIPRRNWMVITDGVPGEKHWSSEMTVKRLMKSYKPFFKNLKDENDFQFKPHPTRYPVAELEYPNTGAVERFILLAPKDKDHYNPVMDLERSLYTIIDCYLTPAQQALFGPIPRDSLSESLSTERSPSPPPPSSQSSDGLSSLHSSVSSLSTVSTDPASGRSMPLLRAVQRAIHRQDGPLFLQAMHKVNEVLRLLKYPSISNDAFGPSPLNPLKLSVTNWADTGMPKKVLMRIIEENYQRSVGPYVQSLKAYEAFSSEVYGELMPSLAYEMIQITKLDEDSLFLDLGSGVGNVCVQASLQTGCKSYGIELLPGPAKIAREMKEHLEVRCKMWGVRIGEIELEQGDMLKSSRVDELIPQADVVLVDNKVFEARLNEALRPKFLDLKEGAIVISLKPFVSSLNARLTERNVDDISAIFDVTERPYHSGAVSWGNGGGSYYVHRVDRNGYADILARFESSRLGSGRSSRSRR
ncbi:hypothetical protein H0H87_007347 [Tephrocybe sp. NHM501043]|nr:hypothetical protein H0H87_007347 [Tephrocybe sp. NHM501043]